ncbi:tetratricopeptide repeat protein [Reichenbachiella agarivorans]|uniref:Tetratricopeptide repeat protein n=1 Tax=Reichenbachiella agarivorans TaxID=2979464 RepID=A0ABY6CUD0_9BACT|nr:tetratricopeptide repeat protein [Reichenbachiella agarivorans]UXP34131.1 tetratricopeptide repeat protein [Reichenbachiella agarivorans]
MNKASLFFVIGMMILQSCLKIESTNSHDRMEDLQDQTVVVVEAEKQEPKKFTSLLGATLEIPTLDKWIKIKRENQLEDAYNDYLTYPDSLEVINWYGRRLSYLYQYNESIDVYTKGIEKFPESYELYRHRGHRYLTIRQIDKAIMDLEKAAFYIRNVPTIMEIDGIPNDRNIPRSSVQFNIWYHLGLAYYIQGNFDKAVSSYKKCIAIADNHDMLVSVTHWLYMTYRKIGNIDAAENLLLPIKKRMNVIENYQYHRLLLMYKGLLDCEDLYDITSTDDTINQLTLGYGVGNWYYYNGKTDEALKVFNKMMGSPYWQAFGYLAAEMELANRFDN